MPTYVPVFKGKLGELTAYSHASPTVLAATRPILEVVPAVDPTTDVKRLSGHLIRRWPNPVPISLDVSALSPGAMVAGTSKRPLAWLGDELTAGGLAVRPVVRGTTDVATLADAAALSASLRNGVCLRLGSAAADPSIEDARLALTTIFRNLTRRPPK